MTRKQSNTNQMIETALKLAAATPIHDSKLQLRSDVLLDLLDPSSEEGQLLTFVPLCVGYKKIPITVLELAVLINQLIACTKARHGFSFVLCLYKNLSSLAEVNTWEDLNKEILVRLTQGENCIDMEEWRKVNHERREKAKHIYEFLKESDEKGNPFEHYFLKNSDPRSKEEMALTEVLVRDEIRKLLRQDAIDYLTRLKKFEKKGQKLKEGETNFTAIQMTEAEEHIENELIDMLTMQEEYQTGKDKPSVSVSLLYCGPLYKVSEYVRAVLAEKKIYHSFHHIDIKKSKRKGKDRWNSLSSGLFEEVESNKDANQREDTAPSIIPIPPSPPPTHTDTHLKKVFGRMMDAGMTEREVAAMMGTVYKYHQVVYGEKLASSSESPTECVSSDTEVPTIEYPPSDVDSSPSFTNELSTQQPYMSNDNSGGWPRPYVVYPTPSYPPYLYPYPPPEYTDIMSLPQGSEFSTQQPYIWDDNSRGWSVPSSYQQQRSQRSYSSADTQRSQEPRTTEGLRAYTYPPLPVWAYYHDPRQCRTVMILSSSLPPPTFAKKSDCHTPPRLPPQKTNSRSSMLQPGRPTQPNPPNNLMFGQPSFQLQERSSIQKTSTTPTPSSQPAPQ